MIKNYLTVIILASLILVSCNSSNKRSGVNPLPNFDAMWDYQHPDSTEIKFKQVLSTLNNNTETPYDAGYHVELLTQIARTQGLQRKFAKAHKTLDNAEDLLQQDMKTATIRYQLERGRVYNSSGKTDKAQSLFLKAYTYGKKNKLDFYTLDAAHMMAIVTPSEKQLEWNEIALKIAEHSEDKRCENWLGTLYNNIGWSYHELEKYNRALELFTKGYNWRKKINDQRGSRIAKWTIARTHRSLKEYDKALKIQLELKKEIEENHLQPDGYVFEELAEIYLLKKKTKSAKKYFQKAYKILSKDPWLKANEKERLKRLKEMGE